MSYAIVLFIAGQYMGIAHMPEDTDLSVCMYVSRQIKIAYKKYNDVRPHCIEIGKYPNA